MTDQHDEARVAQEITPAVGGVESSLAPAQGLNFQVAIEQAMQLDEGSVEVLERLEAMYERQIARDAKAEFVRAMVQLRSELGPILKTRFNPATKSPYANFDDIAAVLDPLCAKYGFTYDFDREILPNREHDYVVCIVMHAGGHEKRNRYPAPRSATNRATTETMAEMGGETYAKRGALKAAFGVRTSDEQDLDGVATSVNPEAERISEEQEMNLHTRIADLNRSDAAFMAYMSQMWKCAPPLERLDQIPASLLAECHKVLDGFTNR